jgi:DNA-binding protein HU-beta
LVKLLPELSAATRRCKGAAVDAVVDAITAALAKGEKISIAGFGNFEVRSRPARVGRNPAPAKRWIAASKAPAFKAAKGPKDAVN